MKDMFTIRHVAKCTGLSRTTLMRLEERGLLKPAHTDSETGYRYYSVDEIAQIMQVKLLLKLGLQYDEIGEYYASGGSSEDIARRLRRQLDILKRGVEEMELRAKDVPEPRAELIDLPQYVCWTRTVMCATIQDKYSAMRATYQEAIEKGLRPLVTEPIFTIVHRADYLEGVYGDAPHEVTFCTPLEPDSAPAEAAVIPPYRALSVLIYGGYDELAKPYLFLGQKVREPGLKPAGFVRALGVVAPATGKAIQENRYVTRLTLPVEE